MSQRDPYFDVRAEVESSLLSARSLHSSYKRILLTLPIESHSTSEELFTTKSELELTLSTLLSDISELDHVVRILEQDVQHSSSSKNSSPKPKFGVGSNEVKKRRAWVTNVQNQLYEMKKTIDAPKQSRPSSSSYHPLLPSSPTTPVNRNHTSSSNDKPNHSRNLKTNQSRSYIREEVISPRDLENQTEEYFQEQESMLLKRQDETLGTISNVVGVLREQANVMGQEISEQNILLDDLDQQIDLTESKLSKANRKLNRFIEENKSSVTFLLRSSSRYTPPALHV